MRATVCPSACWLEGGRPLTRPVPFVDVAAQTERLRADLLSAIEAVMDSGGFVGGPEVQLFEREFSAVLSLPAGVGCSSGTAALSLALEAAGVGPGDEVVVPNLTFIATAAAVCHVGARPVFADVEPGAYTLDPRSLDDAITDRTKAVVPVHLYGTPAEMDDIQSIADARRLVVVEDAAQAHGASYRGRAAGSMGDAAAFSFYPGKNLGAMGDAGFVTSRHPAWVDVIRSLLDHGRRTKYEHDRVGYNHRLDALQAAVLRVKLRHLAEWTEHRRAVAARYDAALAPAGFKVVRPPEHVEAVYHLYVVEVSNREEVTRSLQADDIGCGIHYPLAMHQQRAFSGLDLRVPTPVSESATARVLSLPIDGEISESDQDRVCERFLAVAQA